MKFRCRLKSGFCIGKWYKGRNGFEFTTFEVIKDWNKKGDVLLCKFIAGDVLSIAWIDRKKNECLVHIDYLQINR